jgi:plasmid stabilization system protein ParE
MRYEFHPEALEEYRQATIWYGEREQSIALHFTAAVEDAIHGLLKHRRAGE